MVIKWIRNHFALNAWCQWCYLNSGPEITFIFLGVDVAWGHYVSLDVGLLGFKASLSYYIGGKCGEGSWGWMAGQAVGGYTLPTDGVIAHYEPSVPAESLGRAE